MKKSSHFIKSILGKSEYLLSGLHPVAGELLVLNFHGTQKIFLSAFQHQLDFLEKHFSFLSPNQLEDYYYKQIRSTKPSVLLTFDDGIKNNLHAAKILAERKIQSIFFIVPDFTNGDSSLQENYFRKNIRQFVDASIGNLKEDLTAMNWDDLRELVKLGHHIGAHSTSHTLDATKSDEQKSIHEIVDCKKILAEKINTDVVSFCAPNNSLLSCGPTQMKLIKENYRFFFSTLPGSNLAEKNPFFIHRSNVEVDWSNGAFIQSIGKWDRRRWESKSNLFRKIAE